MSGGRLDGGANALIGSAATDIPSHGAVNVLVGRLWVGLQQRDGLHDLPRLAVAALRNVELDPGLLNGVKTVRAYSFDGDDFRAVHGAQRSDARADGLAIPVDSAGAAQGHTAAELGAGEPDDIPEIPQKRHVRISRGFVGCAV